MDSPSLYYPDTVTQIPNPWTFPLKTLVHEISHILLIPSLDTKRNPV